MKLIYILLLLFPVFANSQNLCSYDKEGKAFNKYDAINDVTNTEEGIRSIVNLITEKIGVFPNFVLQRVVEEENCFAWIEPKYGLRIISYDREFLVAQSKLSETNYWAIVFILSHEIGHHINGHTIGNFGLEESRNNELQADQFAGFIFKKLNGKKEDLIKILDLPIFESNSENSTHPGAEERLTSALKGYNNAQIDNFKIIVNEFEIINSLVMSVNQISSTIESNTINKPKVSDRSIDPKSIKGDAYKDAKKVNTSYWFIPFSSETFINKDKCFIYKYWEEDFSKSRAPKGQKFTSNSKGKVFATFDPTGENGFMHNIYSTSDNVIKRAKGMFNTKVKVKNTSDKLFPDNVWTNADRDRILFSTESDDNKYYYKTIYIDLKGYNEVYKCLSDEQKKEYLDPARILNILKKTE